MRTFCLLLLFLAMAGIQGSQDMPRNDAGRDEARGPEEAIHKEDASAGPGNYQNTTVQNPMTEINTKETCLCAQGSCDYGWVQYKNACYKRFSEIVSWPEAESTCLSHHSHLASIHSEEENDFVYVLMGKPVDPFNGGAYWFGVHDTFKEGEYMNSDGSKMTILPFGSGQPDNLNNEDFIGSWFSVNGHVTWNDYPLTPYAFPFVCKYYLGNRLCGDEH